MALNIHSQFQKPNQLAKSEKYKPFCVSKLPFLALKLVRRRSA